MAFRHRRWLQVRLMIAREAPCLFVARTLVA
jgi:hypothetical protein